MVTTPDDLPRYGTLPTRPMAGETACREGEESEQGQIRAVGARRPDAQSE